MTIVNIDKLMEKEEKKGFVLREIEYIIPDLSYSLMKNLVMAGKELETIGEGKEEEQVDLVLGKTIELICSVVPGLSPDFVEKELSITEIKHIMTTVNQIYSEAEVDEQALELKHYRKKYKDEFRVKNDESLVENESEATPDK